MQTVFFHYNLVQKSFYWGDESVIFFDDRGWWVMEGGVRQLRSLEFIAGPELSFEGIDIPSIIDDLRSWGPVWARWSGKGDQQELILRRVQLLVLNIVTGLRKLKIGCCVMHTGVSHHVDSLAFQTACNLAAVPLLFLYSEVFSTRLIPILQAGDISRRQPMSRNVSGYLYEGVIQDFLATKKQDLPPKNNVKVQGVATMWQLAVPILLWQDVKQLLRVLFDRLKGESGKESLFGFAIASYPFQFTAQALQQRRAIRYMHSKTKRAQHFLHEFAAKRKLKLIIAAHYQPEATSFPEGGVWGNHVDIALGLINKGYRNGLVYKEHPASAMYLEAGSPTRVGMCRSREYYEQLEAVGCEFVDTDYKLSVDPAKCSWYLPVTITGSIAIERSLAGLHTVVTGHPWFKGMPGILLIDEVSSFAEIKEEWVTPDLELARNAFEFLVRLLDCKTIINVPGIGTGKISMDQEAALVFSAEFSAALQGLREYAGSTDKPIRDKE